MDVRTYLEGLGAVVSATGVEHFGAPDEEAGAALVGAGAQIVPLLRTVPLRVTGRDRIAFLHGQLSNDVQGLQVGESNHTLQLNPRGQIVGEAILAVRADDLFLAVEDGRGPEVRASLERHIVFDDVAITDLSQELTAVTVQGAGATALVEQALGASPAPARFVQLGFGDASVLVVRRRRSAAGGFDIHLLARQLPELVTALRGFGGSLAGEPALTLARIAAGASSAALDGGPGVLPQEIGLTSSVSYRKGCYLGQEIMARIEARGAVRRALARLRLDGPNEVLADLVGAGERELVVEDRRVGWLGSVARRPDGVWLALAVLRIDVSERDVLVVGGAAARLGSADAGWVSAPAHQDGVPRPDAGAVQPSGAAGTDL